ncbi:DUF1573 domain-containing protein [Catalinimonas niigatensis]|uniref:DUF1573 domain-containing protein n=1 Tax=Catalinimonas niigatensis TaxID=1397264 RepID=UPI00266626E3|nr:DUF1573 domain-containing protein [Catalinimonas niigatensis]WPP51620.1 DUF1573 domain-containing protein [Catalinimonas niigatensis]
MKKILVLSAALLFTLQLYAQNSSQQNEPVDGPKIAFVENSHDFGDIEQGEKVNYVFKFENSGTEPLILSNVLTTCGCTATSWPREPLAPGEEGEIAVSFNSAGKMGKQNKVVTVVSNAVNAQERVKIITNVLPKKDSTQD